MTHSGWHNWLSFTLCPAPSSKEATSLWSSTTYIVPQSPVRYFHFHPTQITPVANCASPITNITHSWTSSSHKQLTPQMTHLLARINNNHQLFHHQQCDVFYYHDVSTSIPLIWQHRSPSSTAEHTIRRFVNCFINTTNHDTTMVTSTCHRNTGTFSGSSDLTQYQTKVLYPMILRFDYLPHTEYQ